MSSNWLGLGELQSAVERGAAQANQAARANVVAASAMLTRDAMDNFEGAHRKNKPRVPNSSQKPNIVTGTLRRSIRGSGVIPLGFGFYSQTVGPSTVYGRRVEMGFSGTDSMGRHYSQPAYPFFGPAVRKLRGEISAIAAANWRKFITF